MIRTVLVALALAVGAAQCTFAQTDKQAEFSALAKDIASALTKTADKLHGDGVTGYAPGSRQREALSEVSKRFENLSQDKATDRQIDSAAYALAQLAMTHAELYEAVVNEPLMHARLESAEKSVGMRIFVPPQALVRGLEILKQQLAEAKSSRPAPRPKTKKSNPDEDEGEVSEKDIDELMVELEAMPSSAELSRLANRSTAALLWDQMYRLYGTLKAGGRRISEELDVQIMSYFLEFNGPAYRFYRLHAFYDNDRPARALEDLYLKAYCQDEQSFRYSCFTVLSQVALTNARLGRDVMRDQAIKSLDRALRAHSRLNTAIAQVRDSNSSEEVRKRAASQLQSMVPPISDLMRGDQQPWETDEDQTAMVVMREIVATSYWLSKAFGKDLVQTILAVDKAAPGRSSDSDGWVESVLMGGYTASVETSDYSTQLILLRAIRQLDKNGVVGEGLDFDPLKLMEIQALYNAQQFGAARKLAGEQRRLATFKEPASANKSGQFKILASCQAARQFNPKEDAEERTTLAQYLLTKLELKLAVQSREIAPHAKVALAVEYEAHGLFVDPDKGGVRPSELAINWLEYRGALADQKLKRRTAVALKCLLTRRDVAARLGMDFINKSGKDRRALTASIFAILNDSGVFERKGASVADEDFALLQAASLLQAQNGISATTARSVFEDKSARDLLRDVELSQSRMSDQLAELGAGFGMDFTRAMKAMKSGSSDLASMLDVMQKYPDAFAKYSALRNQNIASLAEVQSVLQPGEASMLLTLFDEKLVTVVITRDTAQMSALSVSRKDMTQAIAQLRASVDLLAPESKAVPPRYRVDIAWRLYQQLIQPVAALLSSAHTVYLIAGEDLAAVPFQALVSSVPPAQASVDFRTYRQLQWLGDRHAFVSLPSVHALLKAIPMRKSESVGKVLGIGEAQVSSQIMVDLGLSPMPDTSRLLRKAGKPIDPPPLLKSAASFARLQAASSGDDLRAPDMLLINSHAIEAGKGGRYGTMEPAILLAPSTERQGADFVDPPKVMSLKLSLRSILLLACGTAGGRSKENAQPFAGLVNSFFFAGADSVVATNLPVDPVVAEEFAVSYLQHVRDRGASTAKAVQQAAAGIRCASNSLPCASGARFVWAHPAYWAQFTLVGSGR